MGLEGVWFALCIGALGFTDLGLLAAISVYAVSTIAGAFTFLPSGIGLTEASMVGILVAAGMVSADASAATIITCAITLWWGVGLGWMMLASRPTFLTRLMGSSDLDDMMPPESESLHARDKSSSAE